MDCGEGRQSLHTLSVGAHAYGLWGGEAVITYVVLTFLYEIRRGGCGVEEVGSHAQYLREEASAGDVKWIPEAL